MRRKIQNYFNCYFYDNLINVKLTNGRWGEANGRVSSRPINETRRAQAVIRTGLIANPKPELFQIYCDLAKDLTEALIPPHSLYMTAISMWYIGVRQR